MKGITQKQLAEDLGVPYQRISYLENGHRDPKAEDLIKLADYFGVTTDYLLGRD